MKYVTLINVHGSNGIIVYREVGRGRVDDLVAVSFSSQVSARYIRYTKD